MNRNVFVLAALCLASVGRLWAGDAPSAGEAFSLFKKDVAEEISEELKAQLVRKIEGLELAARLSPENGAAWLSLADAWLKLGIGNFRSGKFAEAKEAFEKVLAIQPGNAKAAEALAACFVQSKEPGQALAILDRSLKADASNVQLWIFRGTVLITMGRLEEAADSLAKAKEIDPGSRNVHAGIGFLALQQHDLSKALAEYDLAIKIDPGDAELWSNRGVVLRYMGDHAGAIESRLHALELKPDDITTRRELSGWLSDAGRNEESARQAQEVIDRQPNDKEAWALLAQANVNQGHWKEGVEELMKARSLGFDDPKALLQLSQAYIGLAEFEKAEEILSSILKKEPENANANAYLGTVRQKQKRVEEGIGYSEKALEIDPKNTIALMNRVSDCVIANLPEETLRYARRAIEINPRIWNAWIAIGLAEEKRGHEKEAFAAYKKATEFAPESVFGWEGVARFSPDAAEAWDAAQKSATIAPNDPTAQVLPAYAKIRFGKTQEAVPLLEAVVARFPDNQMAVNELNQLRPKLNLNADAPSSPEISLEPPKKNPWKVVQHDEKTSAGTVHTYQIMLNKQAGWILLTATCKSVKRSPELLEAAQKAAAEHPEDAGKLQDLGMILLALSSDEHSVRRASEAEGVFRKVVEIGENRPNAGLWLAMSLCAEGRYSEAESICRKVTEDDPQMVSAWIYLGQSLVGRGRGLEAVEAYAHSITLSPQDSSGWNLLYDAYSGMDKRADGEMKLKELLKAFPDSSPGWLALGRALSVPGRYEEAIVAFRKALELAEQYAAAWNGLGSVLHLQGKSAEAEKDLRHSIELEPENSIFLANLANCLLSEKKFDEAVEVSRRAVEISPKDIAPNAILTQVLIEKGDMEAASAACDQLEDLDAGIAGLLRRRIKK